MLACPGTTDGAARAAEDAAGQKAVEAAVPPSKKGSHRRGNSLSGLLPLLLPKRMPSLPLKPAADASPSAVRPLSCMPACVEGTAPPHRLTVPFGVMFSQVNQRYQVLVIECPCSYQTLVLYQTE